MSQGVERKIIVTGCRAVTSGEKNGREWTIYEVEALREDHTPLPPDTKLRSFTELPIGELVEVTLEKYDSEQYGTSWTVKRKGGGSRKRYNELVERVEQLEGQVRALSERVFGGGASTPAPTPAAIPAEPMPAVPPPEEPNW